MKTILSIALFLGLAQNSFAAPDCAYVLTTCAGEPGQYCSMYVGVPSGYCPDSSCDCIDGPGVVVIKDSNFEAMVMTSGQTVTNVSPGMKFYMSQIKFIKTRTGTMQAPALIEAGARILKISSDR